MFTKTVNKDRAFVCRRAACVCVLSSVCHADCPSECIIMTPAILPTIRPIVSLLPAAAAAAAEAKRLTSRGRSLTDIAQCRETLAQWPPLAALCYFLTCRSVSRLLPPCAPRLRSGSGINVRGGANVRYLYRPAAFRLSCLWLVCYRLELGKQNMVSCITTSGEYNMDSCEPKELCIMGVQIPTFEGRRCFLSSNYFKHLLVFTRATLSFCEYCVCLSICHKSKWMNRSSWFLPWRFLSTSPALPFPFPSLTSTFPPLPSLPFRSRALNRARGFRGVL